MSKDLLAAREALTALRGDEAACASSVVRAIAEALLAETISRLEAAAPAPMQRRPAPISIAETLRFARLLPEGPCREAAQLLLAPISDRVAAFTEFLELYCDADYDAVLERRRHEICLQIERFEDEVLTMLVWDMPSELRPSWWGQSIRVSA